MEGYHILRGHVSLRIQSPGRSFFFPLSGCCVNFGRWEGEEIWICCFGTSGFFIFRWLGLGELRSFTFLIQKNVNFNNFIFPGFCVLQFFCLFFFFLDNV